MCKKELFDSLYLNSISKVTKMKQHKNALLNKIKYLNIQQQTFLEQ